jgi:outer membrane autotransporter protein
MTSGNKGDDGAITGTGTSTGTAGAGGAGGAATFVAGTLTAPSINLAKKDGDLTFTIGTLYVGKNTAFTMDNATSTGTFAVSVNGLSFANGSALTITRSQGSENFSNFGGNLAVAGTGNVLKSDVPYDAAGSGKTHTFDLTGVAASSTMLTAQTTALDISGANISLVSQTVRPQVAEGESLTLLSATALTADQTGLTVQTASGDVYTLRVENNQLLAMLKALSPTTPAYERLKAYAEGRAANLAFVNQGQDLILNQGFGSALAATSGPGHRMAAFSGAGGGKSRYNTGSHVDVEGFSMLAGLALGNDVGMGRLTLGAFFEGGWGSYDSHNSFSNYASVNGDGDTSYMGGGVLGRYDLTSGILSGLYFDASARLGRAKMDFGSGDIQYNGSDANFDSSSLYYGLHGGVGYLWSITDDASLDLSAKLLWTRQEGDSITVHGDRVRFKDTDSLRTRLGGRFTYAINEHIAPYVGAYWEHEYDSKASSTVNGRSISSPDIKGDTGMGEIGLSFKPVVDSGLSLDLGVQGYTGKREGVSGSLHVKFEF